MINALMTDRQLNDHIDRLLETPREDRLASAGGWAKAFDIAMVMWEDRHSGTRPPAFAKVGPPPRCFSGDVPPIYNGVLE
jgi:hypothetical protein